MKYYVIREVPKAMAPFGIGMEKHPSMGIACVPYSNNLTWVVTISR